MAPKRKLSEREEEEKEVVEEKEEEEEVEEKDPSGPSRKKKRKIRRKLGARTRKRERKQNKMPGLLETCENQYGTNDLYTLLDVTKEASESELKRAYYKLSMKVHPDRVAEDEKEDATAKFQTLGKVYSILSDKEKRAVYDETGEVDEENDIPMDRDWYSYWRLLFKISTKDIEEFEQQYKGSKEEKKDLIEAYMKYKGSMKWIIQTVMCATVDDEERFSDILKDLIKREKIPKYSCFTKEKSHKKEKRRSQAAEEAAEAEEAAKEMGLGEGDDALRQMILQRQGSREQQAANLFAHLEAKYKDEARNTKNAKHRRRWRKNRAEKRAEARSAQQSEDS